ncbi:MAG TPA: hypothetical protein VJL88_04540 [Nitrospira sp.]|nr:hypothetical protein [Nitrospira sp.]
MNTAVRIILLIQTIGGGYFGAVMTATSAEGMPVVMSVTGIVMFLGITLAGISFALSPGRTWPVLAALAVQTIWISTPAFSYKISTGLAFWIITMSGQGNVWANFGADVSLGSFGIQQTGFGLNIVALSLLAIVWMSAKGQRDRTKHVEQRSEM